jgi:sugar lactone lactonase YvrE
VDEALYETNLIGNLREILDIYDKSTLEVENDGDFNEQGSYFINTPSSPYSYKKSSDSLSLSNIAHTRSSTPSCFLFLKILKGWL